MLCSTEQREAAHHDSFLYRVDTPEICEEGSRLLNSAESRDGYRTSVIRTHHTPYILHCLHNSPATIVPEIERWT